MVDITDRKRMEEELEEPTVSLRNLINDILDFSKVEAGKLNLKPVHFDLRYLHPLRGGHPVRIPLFQTDAEPQIRCAPAASSENFTD